MHSQNPHGLASFLRRNPLQTLAFASCFVFGLLMIINIQLGGEATWFWYATLLRHGVKLYGDTHLALQPWYTLQTDAWMHVAGRRCIPYECLSVLNLFLLCLGMLLVLRESIWPDRRKAAIFVAAFFIDLFFVAIRFDDFHVVNDALVLFTIVLLLRVFHARTTRAELLWAAGTGALAGLSFMNRSTDGGTLLAAAACCVPFLAQRKKAPAALLYLLSAALTMAVVVWLTGDTFHDYLANSILHAASAKGGTGTVFRGPVIAFTHNLVLMPHPKRFWFLAVLLPGLLAHRWARDKQRIPLLAEVAGAALLIVVGLALPSIRRIIWNGFFPSSLNIFVQTAMYPLCIWILARAALAWLRPDSHRWDAREILLLIPAATLVSAAVSEATGTTNSTIEMTLLFLLSTLWLPISGRRRVWTDAWIVSGLVAAMAIMLTKVWIPYSWNAYAYKPMFEGRQIYHHPVYGTMYLQTDALQFNTAICSEIQQAGGSPELLSLPYSYSNYFCDIAPWHNYVQTWFDTATPQTMQVLMHQLDAAPPRFILYERQISILHAHEVEYNHGRPISHRQLDEQIMDKLASGQWKLLDRRDYLIGDGWFLIQTQR